MSGSPVTAYNKVWDAELQTWVFEKQSLTDTELRATALPVALASLPMDSVSLDGSLDTRDSEAREHLEIIADVAQEIDPCRDRMSPGEEPMPIRVMVGDVNNTGQQNANLSLPVVIAADQWNDLFVTCNGLVNAKVGQVFVMQDCRNYRSVALQITTTGVTAGVITFYGSNDGSGWVATGLYDLSSGITAPATTTGTLTAGTKIWVGPIQTRYFLAQVTTNISTGTIGGSAMFRQNAFSTTSWASNLVQVGGTATVTGGVAGIQAIGGNITVGTAPTANPVPVGAADHAGLTRRLLVDNLGQLVNVGADTRLSGYSRPNPIYVKPMDSEIAYPGVNEALSLILSELKLQNFILKELPNALNNGLSMQDDLSSDDMFNSQTNRSTL